MLNTTEQQKEIAALKIALKSKNDQIEQMELFITEKNTISEETFSQLKAQLDLTQRRMESMESINQEMLALLKEKQEEIDTKDQKIKEMELCINDSNSFDQETQEMLAVLKRQLDMTNQRMTRTESMNEEILTILKAKEQETDSLTQVNAALLNAIKHKDTCIDALIRQATQTNHTQSGTVDRLTNIIVHEKRDNSLLAGYAPQEEYEEMSIDEIQDRVIQVNAAQNKLNQAFKMKSKNC